MNIPGNLVSIEQIHERSTCNILLVGHDLRVADLLNLYTMVRALV
jgi:hypothetical protein